MANAPIKQWSVWKLCFFFFTTLFSHHLQLQGQVQPATMLFRNSAEVYSLQRNHLGIYRDSKVFNGLDFHPASVANIGIGLIQLCISDAMEWDASAEDKVLTTLKSVTGNNLPFLPDRSSSGFFRHFIDMNTGAQAWNSEYSTIDSGILTAGALFAKRYFCGNDSIQHFVNLLWHSIDWSKTIANPMTGGIYREILPDGTGNPSTVTLPFNEYMLVAYLAWQQEGLNGGPATELWDRYYAEPANLPTIYFMGIPLLTDHQDFYLSHFVIQFAYYLCYPFTSNDKYISYLDNSRRADSLWWAINGSGISSEWGLGAGSCSIPPNYCVDNLGDNPTLSYSPQIISGFIPVYTEAVSDLLQLYQNGNCRYVLPNSGQDTILWRKSLSTPGWNANEVQGVDYSTMLFGLASLPEHLGPDFFKTYNNFFGDTCTTLSLVTDKSNQKDYLFRAYPNPFTNEITISFSNNYSGAVNIQIVNQQSQLIRDFQFDKPNYQHKKVIDLSGVPLGLYFIEITTNRGKEIHKGIKAF